MRDLRSHHTFSNLFEGFFLGIVTDFFLLATGFVHGVWPLLFVIAIFTLAGALMPENDVIDEEEDD